MFLFVAWIKLIKCRVVTDESKFYKNYLNRSDTEVELEILFMASANKLDMVNTSILLAFFNLPEPSMVSVTTKFLILDFLTFSTALPLKTPWERIHELLLHLFFLMNLQHLL